MTHRVRAITAWEPAPVQQSGDARGGPNVGLGAGGWSQAIDDALVQAAFREQILPTTLRRCSLFWIQRPIWVERTLASWVWAAG